MSFAIHEYQIITRPLFRRRAAAQHTDITYLQPIYRRRLKRATFTPADGKAARLRDIIGDGRKLTEVMQVYTFPGRRAIAISWSNDSADAHGRSASQYQRAARGYALLRSTRRRAPLRRPRLVRPRVLIIDQYYRLASDGPSTSVPRRHARIRDARRGLNR